MLNPVKLALRVTTANFDKEIESLIDAALRDLDVAGVGVSSASMDEDNPLILRAVITYCKLYFGEPERVEVWDRLKASYDEQKMQLSMATGYRRSE
ncbi:MAG: DNA-packaging protein [Oscillibacter sp.]|nr:DNA-packaging protein [Oscillibacter sp.]